VCVFEGGGGEVNIVAFDVTHTHTHSQKDSIESIVVLENDVMNDHLRSKKTESN